MTYQLNSTKSKEGLPFGRNKRNHLPALSPLATAIKVAIVGLGLAAHSAAQAATIEVNSNSDNGSGCTLRDAVISINDGALRRGCVSTGAALGTDDTINVAASVAGDTVTLANGLIKFDPGTIVSINGNGITVDANQLSGVFFADSATLSIDDMTITGGNPSRRRNGTKGGGIQAYNSSLAITNSTISGNYAEDDGAAFSLYESSAIVSNTTISSNKTRFESKSAIDAVRSSLIVNQSIIVSNNTGGSFFPGSSPLVIGLSESNAIINNSSISNNGGSGILIFDSDVSVNNSTISDNSGIGVRGIGDNSLTLSNSTISGSGFSGVDVGNATIRNSTISGNSYSGISVVFPDPNIVVINSTVAGNALGGGGDYHNGIYIKDGSVEVINSIVSDSINVDCFTGPTDRFRQPTIVSDSASIIADGSCGTNARAVDPLLLPLADNGCAVKHSTPNGPACVMTHALGAGSPAIDTAVNSDLATDQRGTPRPQGGASDVGAFELSSVVPTAPGFSVTSVNAVEGDKVLFTITLDEPQASRVGYDFSTLAGTATDGEDYVGRVGRVFFPAGETVGKRRVETLEDGLSNEGDETFSLVVTDINDPSATVTTQATIEEKLPELAVAQVRAREGDEKAVVVVELSKPSNERVTVKFRTVARPTQNNPATDGEDYIGRTGTIVFPAGVTKRTRTITLIDDAVDEANEVFRFELSEPSNAKIASGSFRQRVFILNDD